MIKKLQQILVLFADSDVIVVGDSPMLSSVDVEELSGDDDNEVVRASWTDGEHNFSVVFDEGGLKAGRWEDGCYIAEDNGGNETKICFFDLAKKSPLSEMTEIALFSKIEDHVLEVANLYDELTTSDLQGVAGAKAREIVQLVRSFKG